MGATASRFSVDAVFRAIDKFSAPIVKMESRVRRFTRNIERSMRKANRAANKFFRGMKKGARVLGMAALAVGLVGRVVLKAGADFEQAITNVGAVGLKSRDQIAQLEAQAKMLGETTKFSATEAANAMEILAKAGFSANQIMEATPGVLDAAAASGLEMAEVANVMSNVLKGMGLEMSEATRVADVLALASSKTNSTIGSLGESMKNVSATASLVGLGLEETVGAVALLQDVGLDASVAGSSLNTMLVKLAKPPASLAKVMRRMSLSFKKANGDMKSFPDVLETISQLAESSGGTLSQLGILSELTGLRGAKAALQLKKLIDPDNNKLKALTEQLNEAAGAAKRMARLRMDTLNGDMTILSSTLEGLKISIFDEAQGPLRGIVQSITEWVRQNKTLIVGGVKDFLETVRRDGPMIIDILGRVARVVGVFAVLATGIKLATLAMVGFNIVMAANPIGLLITAIGLLAFFWKDIVGVWKEATIIVERLFKRIIDGAMNLIPEPIKKVLGLSGGVNDPNPIPLLDEGQSGGLGLGSGVPQVQSRTTTSTSTEKVQLDINDPEGRTTVTRGRTGGSSGLSVGRSGAD